jgi:hypothetical protein
MTHLGLPSRWLNWVHLILSSGSSAVWFPAANWRFPHCPVCRWHVVAPPGWHKTVGVPKGSPTRLCWVYWPAGKLWKVTDVLH